jgi:hypothetical protein
VSNKTVYIEVLAEVGEVVDTTDLLRELVEGERPETQGDAYARDRMVDLVRRSPLPAGWEATLRSALDTAERWKRSDLWELATAHRLAAFDDAALPALLQPGREEEGLAANFAKVRSWDPSVHTDFETRCLDRLTSADGTEWLVPRLLEYLELRGRRREVAELIARFLRELGPRHHAAKLRSWARIRAGAPFEHDPDASLSLAIGPLVEIGARVADLLPVDVAKDVIGYDLSTCGDAARLARRVIAARLSADDVDAQLALIEPAEARIAVLGDLCDLGSTAKREALLCADLPEILDHAGTSDALARVVDRLWSPAVASAAVKAIAGASWRPEVGSQLAYKVINVVARKMTKELAATLVAPALATVVDDESRRILEFWYEFGTTRRQGERS